MGMTPLALVLATGCFGLDSYKDPATTGATDSGHVFPPAETGTPDTGWHALDDTATSDNGAPSADAGGDLTGWVGDVLNLDGNGSMDPDGDPLEFTWFLVSRPPASAAELINEDRADASIYLDVQGTYELQLTVTDGALFDSDTAVITADKANGLPVADAGPDQSVTEGTVVTLDGTASTDPDGDRLGWSWALISRPGTSLATLSDPTVARPTFTADQAGTYEFELVVNDGTTDSAPDGIRVQATSSSSGGSGGTGGSSGGSSCSCAELEDEVLRRHPLARMLPAAVGVLPALVLFGVRRRDD